MSTFSPSGLINFHCQINPWLFPFDIQNCTLEIQSLRYTVKQQILKIGDSGFNHFISNDEWDIFLGKSEVYNHTYDTGRSYSNVKFNIILQRKSLYYIIVIIIPCIITAFVVIVNFILPIHDPSRLELTFTCLLAFSVFQSIIINELPHSSDNPSLLLVFLTVLTILVGVFIVLQGCNLYFARKVEDNPSTSRILPLQKAISFLSGETLKYCNLCSLIFFLSQLIIATLICFIILPAVYNLKISKDSLTSPE